MWLTKPAANSRTVREVTVVRGGPDRWPPAFQVTTRAQRWPWRCSGHVTDPGRS